MGRNFDVYRSEALTPIEIKVTVKPAPRVVGTPDDYAAQEKLLDLIRELAAEIHQSVNRFRRVKTQLNDRLSLLRKMDGQEELVQLAADTKKATNRWGSGLIQSKQKTFRT